MATTLSFNSSNAYNLRTATTTTTVTTTTTIVGAAKRDAALLAMRQVTVVPSLVPTYASACSGTSRYSSACSCWGITAQTTTAPTPITTTTQTATVTVTVSVCPTGETKCGSTCVDLNTSPDNCGACGVQCPSGSQCVNGACSQPSCDGKTCATFTNCSPGGASDCQCYTTTDGTGFCAQNQLCAGLADCQTNADCGAGSICAVQSCCTRNVCLPAECGNPALVFKRYEKRAVGDGCSSGTPCSK
jgi:hypothetical protein